MDLMKVDEELMKKINLRNMKNGKKLMQSTATLTKILKETQQRIRSGQDDMFYIEAKIPPRFKGKTLANFKGDTEKYKQAILKGQSIFITGPCGIGKTHLAVALATEWFAENLHITDSEIQPSKFQFLIGRVKTIKFF